MGNISAESSGGSDHGDPLTRRNCAGFEMTSGRREPNRAPNLLSRPFVGLRLRLTSSGIRGKLCILSEGQRGDCLVPV